jgi:hypothetical protein
MNTLWIVITALPSLVDETPAPEDVKAGWLGFAVFIALVVAVAVLGLSLRKHLRKVDFEEPADPEGKDERTQNGTA